MLQLKVLKIFVASLGREGYISYVKASKIHQGLSELEFLLRFTCPWGTYPVCFYCDQVMSMFRVLFTTVLYHKLVATVVDFKWEKYGGN